MNIAEKIKKTLAKTDDGVVLTPSDFDIPISQQPSLIVSLNRLVAKGTLKRLSRGKYYKPKDSIFGVLPPDTYQKVKEFIVKDGQVIGYITGTNAFAKLGLTTQISGEITIGTNTYRRPRTRGMDKITFVLQPNPIREDEIDLYVILDAMRFINDIPATTPSEAVKILIQVIRRLPKLQQKRLQELAMSYTPFVRALLGAIFERLSFPIKVLRDSLNGTTYYKLHIDEDVLPTKSNWRIL